MSVYLGVNFNNLRKAIWLIYFGESIPEVEAYKRILPMQQNFFNPIEDEPDETGRDPVDSYVQYFIEWDRKITNDQFGYNTNFNYKIAKINLRFIGASAEDWAKSTHHFTKRQDISKIFKGVCNADVLESPGDIYPVNTNFFGLNSSIAFDVDLLLLELALLLVK